MFYHCVVLKVKIKSVPVRKCSHETTLTYLVGLVRKQNSHLSQIYRCQNDKLITQFGAFILKYGDKSYFI